MANISLYYGTLNLQKKERFLKHFMFKFLHDNIFIFLLFSCDEVHIFNLILI